MFVSYMQLVAVNRAEEINRKWSEVQRSHADTVLKAVELGGELFRAREEIGYGFGPWLAENVEMNRGWAYRLIGLYERRDQIGGAATISGALELVRENKRDEWLAAGYEEGEPPLADIDDAPDHWEVLSNEIHPMFLLDPVQKAKWSDISNVRVYRAVINGKRVRVAGTRELLEMGNQQRITRLPQDILSLDQGNQQRREGARAEHTWVSRQWADAALNRLAEDKSQRSLQLVQFLAHGLPDLQKKWLEDRLKLNLDDPGDRISDAVWGLLLVRDGEELWDGFKQLSGLDHNRIVRQAREEHRNKRTKTA